MDTSRGTGTAGAWPSELASMAPGPGLATVLASIDRSQLTADAMFDLIAARARLLWHVQGELLADFAQAVAATLAAEPLPPDEDEEHVTDAVGEHVGWTVHWTTSYAQGRVWVAVALRQRLPMVLAALQAGRIDQAKAEAFVEALACVKDDVAVRIADRLLPKAVTWTLRELRASLRYHVDRADPGAARRRYARRVATRDVTLRAQPDGTANLSAQGLAPHRAAAAYDRIDRIARAARASGDVRTLAQLRADALCDVLAGIPFHLSPSTDPITADVVLAAPLLAARTSQLRGSTAQADASAERDLPPSWHVPAWHTESRCANTKTTDPDPARAGTGGDGRDPRGAFPSDVVPPEVEPVGVIDLYDYDRACLTDEDRAWATIGCEPPGAGEDETPDWWHLCRPARRPRSHHPHPDRSTSQPPTPAEAEAKKSRFENRNPRPEPPGSGQPTQALAEKSRSENRNPRRDPSGYGYSRPRQSEDSRQDLDTTESGNRPEPARQRWWSDPEDVVWALAQADALHGHAILSPDVLVGDRCACGGRLSVRPGVVDVQIKLTTLAGLDEHPALIAGLGVTLAPLARHIAFDPVTRPTWRWSVFNDHGVLLHHGITRHRPIGPESCSENTKTGPDDQPTIRPCTCSRFEPGHRRGTIELQLTLATLHELIANPTRAPGWQAVLTDIADQIDRDRQTNHRSEQTGRMPDAVEEAFIRARDRSCRAPHCPVPASRCELDHRLEYAKGGPSHRDNVDCRCKRHHHLREHGYRITKTGTTATWTVPNGRTYTVTTDKDLILTRED